MTAPKRLSGVLAPVVTPFKRDLSPDRERYRKIPYRKRDDEAEMRRRVDPNWKRVLPRW